MQQQRVVRALHLQEMAASLDAEAASWRLLWHLHGPETQVYPGGLGGPKLPGCARGPTVAQLIAAILNQDAELNRCDNSQCCHSLDGRCFCSYMLSCCKIWYMHLHRLVDTEIYKSSH